MRKGLTQAVAISRPGKAPVPAPAAKEPTGLVALTAENSHAGDVAGRRSPEIVGQSQADIGALTIACAPLKLQVHLISHAQPGRADRVAEALEPAVDLAGDFAAGVEETIEHVLDRPAF